MSLKLSKKPILQAYLSTHILKLKDLARILGITVPGLHKKVKKERWRYRLVDNPKGGGPMMIFKVHELPGDVQKIIAETVAKEDQERREKIGTALQEKDDTQADIAGQLGILRPTVCHVVAGMFSGCPVVKALVKAGMPKELIQSYKL